MTKTRTTRIGKLLGAALLASLALPSSTRAGEKKPTAAPAVLAGTVFRDSGFALRGAEVFVTALPESDSEPGKKKKKPKQVEWRAFSDARGEFWLRLPAGPASYNVVVRAQGFEAQQKVVKFAASERLDFHFLLAPGGEKK